MRPILSILCLGLILCPSVSRSALIINNLNTANTENFDTLAFSGTSSILPTGWVFSESGGSANSIYTAGTGSSTTGDVYSFGAASSTDRALGGLQSGTLIPTFGVQIQNGTGLEIVGFTISYTGEEWRLGTANRLDSLNFQYSTDATSLITGTWISVATLIFSTPNQTTVGMKNGNASANQTAISGSLSVSVMDGNNVWFRWTDFNASGSDDGLAIDDFSVIATGAAAVPEPAEWGVISALGLLGICGVSTWRKQRAIKRAALA